MRIIIKNLFDWLYQLKFCITRFVCNVLLFKLQKHNLGLILIIKYVFSKRFYWRQLIIMKIVLANFTNLFIHVTVQ